jgi:hypothetical protein
MYGVMRPVAESILPEAALSRQSRGAVTGHATGAAYTSNATRSTRTTYSTGPAHTTDAADTTYSTGPAHTTDAADSTYSTGPAHTADATDTTYSTGPAHTADATDTTDSSGPAHTADTTDAAGDGVAIEAVVVVDINTAATPAATPAPTAAPPCSHHHSRAKGDRGARGVVAGRIGDRWIWIHRFTVYSCRLICRHVDNFRIGRLYHHHVLVFDYSRFHCLLWSGVQSTLILCLPAHALNGIHQPALLRQEGIAKISGPLQVVSQ